MSRTWDASTPPLCVATIATGDNDLCVVDPLEFAPAAGDDLRFPAGPLPGSTRPVQYAIKCPPLELISGLWVHGDGIGVSWVRALRKDDDGSYDPTACSPAPLMAFPDWRN